MQQKHFISTRLKTNAKLGELKVEVDEYAANVVSSGKSGRIGVHDLLNHWGENTDEC